MKLRWIAVPLSLAAALAAAHTYWVLRGIHFKAGGESVDFGLPPARYARTTEDDGWRPGTTYRTVSYPFDPWIDERIEEEKTVARWRAGYQAGQTAERKRRWKEALAVYRRMAVRGEGNPAFVRGRIDLLQEVEGKRVQGLSEFLAATPEPRAKPKALPSRYGPELAPFVEYEAAIRSDASPTKLLALAQRYPTSAKAPAALIMASRALTGEGRHAYPLADLRAADAAMSRLLRDYPRSRFAWSARGERGRIEFLRKRLGNAVAQYERQYREAENIGQRRRALESILLCEQVRGRQDAVTETYLRLLPWVPNRQYVVERLLSVTSKLRAAEARRLGERLRRDPKLLTAYLEFRGDFTKPTKDLYAFASAPGIEGIGLARLANNALHLRDAARARRFAGRALQKPDGDDSRPMATFVLATLDRRAGRNGAARAKYASILARWPKSYLVGGARENLAILQERRGDLAAALDQYLALGYQDDIAYMIDVRMTSRQLESYLRTRPRGPRRSTLIYTLGMRYLREAKWDSAETTLRRLTTHQRRTLTNHPWIDHKSGLQDPLSTVRALRRLDGAFDKARGRKAKAAALYAMGDYYYRHRQLLLYSPPGLAGRAVGRLWNVVEPSSDGTGGRAGDRTAPR